LTFIFNITAQLTLALLLINLLSYFGAYYYIFEIFTHFKWQYLLLFLLSSLSFSFFYRRKTAKKWLLISLFGVSLNTIAIVPLHLAPPINLQTKNDFSLLMANVLSSNPSKAKFVNLIQQQAADFIVVLEVSPQWAAALKAIHLSYPYQKILPRHDNFGIALYSKHPLSNIQVHDFSQNQTPSISANSSINGKEVLLLATHPFPPMNQIITQQQKYHFDAISRFIKKSSKPVVLAGDLNTTQWSSAYKNFINSSSLKNTRQGKGILASWQVGSVLQLPLDHVLISQNINTLKIETTKSIDSDHLPIYVELSF